MRAPLFLIRSCALASLGLLAAGCAHGYRFKDAPPILEAGDAEPSPVPKKTDFEFVEYAVSSSLRYPVDSHLDTRRSPRSRDVNSLDEVPASTWFTPRLGAAEISPAELVKGPEKDGPPQTPFTVTHAKTKGNSPGFIIKDARGLKYLIKFDQLDFPDIESTVNFVVNRLFWGFGYNVPEDYVFQFKQEDAKPGPDTDPDLIEEVFVLSHRAGDGRYRTVASRFLEGGLLGPIGARGTRRGDANDRIAHENRRVLRALGMFSAYLNNSGMRSDNSMDVYVGEPGQGHTVHYLLDFGEALGVHGAEKDRPSDGFEHFFSLKESAGKFFAFGLPVKKWERLEMKTLEPQDWFESEAFEAGEWKETTPFLPITMSQPDDDYWAAKILLALKPAHLEALFDAVKHPDANYARDILKTLEKRREKILQYALGRVSPLEPSKLAEGRLVLQDLGKAVGGLESSEYRVRFLNSNGRRVAEDLTVRSGDSLVEIPVEKALEAAKGYLRVDVTAVREAGPAPRAAQFHIRQSGAGAPKLAGVVH